MKKWFLLLVFFVISSGNVWAEKNMSTDIDSFQKIKRQVEKYKQECSQEAYPDDDTNHVYALIDDSLKYANQKYNQCIKDVIINKISGFASKEDSEKMVHSLNMLQKEILDFYWTLHNMEDNGFIGRQQNDAALGYYYDHILEDIILYEQNFQHY